MMWYGANDPRIERSGILVCRRGYGGAARVDNGNDKEEVTRIK